MGARRENCCGDFRWNKPTKQIEQVETQKGGSFLKGKKSPGCAVSHTLSPEGLGLCCQERQSCQDVAWLVCFFSEPCSYILRKQSVL